MSLQLFWRFVVISTLAFGGGQAALPLVEQMTVGSGWVSAQDFSTALAVSYVTPGPVLILATFIGYRVYPRRLRRPVVPRHGRRAATAPRLPISLASGLWTRGRPGRRRAARRD